MTAKNAFDKALEQAVKREELVSQLHLCKAENHLENCSQECPDYKACSLIKKYKRCSHLAGHLLQIGFSKAEQGELR